MKTYNPYQTIVRREGEHVAILTDHELGLILSALALMEDMKDSDRHNDPEAAECELLRMKLPAWRGE